MLFDPSNLNVTALKELIKKLSDKYSHAIKDDRPLKDVKEIKKAIHYVERKIAEAEGELVWKRKTLQSRPRACLAKSS